MCILCPSHDTLLVAFALQDGLFIFFMGAPLKTKLAALNFFLLILRWLVPMGSILAVEGGCI